jgi:small subunit ribosomal protein S2
MSAASRGPNRTRSTARKPSMSASSRDTVMRSSPPSAKLSRGVDYVIPGNDDAMRAIELYAGMIADAVLDGKASLPEVALGEDEFVELDAEGNVKKSSGRKKKPAKKATIKKKATVRSDAARPKAAAPVADDGEANTDATGSAEAVATESAAESPAKKVAKKAGKTASKKTAKTTKKTAAKKVAKKAEGAGDDD